MIFHEVGKVEVGYEKMIWLDTKTRWNRLLAMSDRFFGEKKSAVSKTLTDIYQENILDNIDNGKYRRPEASKNWSWQLRNQHKTL